VPAASLDIVKSDSCCCLDAEDDDGGGRIGDSPRCDAGE